MSQYISEVYGTGGISAKVVAHSSNPFVNGCPDLFTLELNYHRYIHSEFMTHRVFSRNASSSRALPVEGVLERISREPAIPIHWGKNQSGMQADGENNAKIQAPDHINDVNNIYAWLLACKHAREYSAAFHTAGYHKQVVNRITEPYAFIKVVVTATDWDNFFSLRIHPDAQPEINELANCMKKAMLSSKSTTPNSGTFANGLPYVHAPYTTDKDMQLITKGDIDIHGLMAISTGRCARVSYLNHDKSDANYIADIALHDTLLKARHMSPFEHPAMMMVDNDPETAPDGATHQTLDKKWWSGNFRQWSQYRQMM